MSNVIWDSLGTASPPVQGSPLTNDVPVWNGTAWVPQKLLTASISDGTILNADVDPAAAIAYSKLALALSIVNGDIAANAGIVGSKLAAAANVLGSQIQFSKGAAPPGSPADGDLWLLPADATNGVEWLFKYNAGSASANKWEFIGGAALYAEVATSETTSSATYAALATAGPSIALPRVGDYDVAIGCGLLNASAGAFNFMSYDIGGTGAVDADAISDQTGSTSNWQQPMRTRRKAGLTAVTLTAKYKSPSATVASFQNRFMSVVPVRVQ